MALTATIASGGPVTDCDENKIKKETHKRHVTSIKVFVAITFFGFAAYIPRVAAFTVVKNHYFISYMYFINHINNPLIYMFFHKSFRADVKLIISKIFRINEA